MKLPFDKLTESEMLALMKEARTDKTKDIFRQMVNYLRHQQMIWMEHDAGQINGVEIAKQFVQQGHMTMKLYLDILPAIENYNTPYTINE